MSRRQIVGAGASIAATAWVAPSVLALDRVAAATGSDVCENPQMLVSASWEDPPPLDLDKNTGIESDDEVFVFFEQGPVALEKDIKINRVTEGSFNGKSEQNVEFLAGTVVCSHFVHANRIDDTDTPLTGSLTFPNATILGLIYRSGELKKADFLEVPGTDYEYDNAETEDLFTWSGGTLSWSLVPGNEVRGIRILTECP
ncbi:MAG: hypothetical protein HKN94_07490 [Acidimicrobiales bacterium]|nr:hypothetical protein [Acidimicrobiales bacterium]